MDQLVQSKGLWAYGWLMSLAHGKAYAVCSMLQDLLGRDRFHGVVRKVIAERSWPTPTWLSDKQSDPNELVNLADDQPEKLREMQRKLKQTLIDLKAPAEQIDRLGLVDV